MPAVEARKPMAAGRKWLRSYFNGCAFKVFDAAMPPGLIHRPFLLVAEWLFRSSGLALIGTAPRGLPRTAPHCPPRPCCSILLALHHGRINQSKLLQWGPCC